jgi:hypothetical protein
VITTAEATPKGTTEVHGFASKLGYLPVMAFAYTGDKHAITDMHSMDSSFCERLNSVAKDILTEERTLLDERELKMAAVLRINRAFVECMKEMHPDLVQVGRGVGPHLMSGCGPGPRATCSAALFGVPERGTPSSRHYPRGTGRGAGGGLPDVHEIAINPHTRFFLLQTAGQELPDFSSFSANFQIHTHLELMR